jgi:hypothetical protein
VGNKMGWGRNIFKGVAGRNWTFKERDIIQISACNLTGR